MCGKPLGYWIVFIGGPASVDNRLFNDGPMHEDCARYSMQACPFLAGKRSSLSDPKKRPPKGEITVDPTAAERRPERIALYFTRGFEVVADRERSYLRPAKATRIVWVEG